jgi:hypothetical protein
VNPSTPDIRHALNQQLKELENRAESERKRKRHFRQWFEVLHVVIGLPAAVLAGAATVTALKEVAPSVIAVLAGAATVLSAAQLFLRSADRAALNRVLEAEFGRLVSDARRTRELELPLLGEEKATELLKGYQEKFAELQQRSPLAR